LLEWYKRKTLLAGWRSSAANGVIHGRTNSNKIIRIILEQRAACSYDYDCTALAGVLLLVF